MTDAITKYKSFAAQLLRDPDDPQTLVDQFALLTKESKHHNRHYHHLARRAYHLCPDRLETIVNYAASLEYSGRYAEALEFYAQCISICQPDFMPQLLHDIGVAYRGMGDNENAIKYYDASIELTPSPFFKRDRSIAVMAGATMGTHSLVDGLKDFESRRQCAEAKFKETGKLTMQARLPAGTVHWQGEDLTGKHVVVYHEEGTGDYIQFCRFIPQLYDMGVASVKLTGPIPDVLELVKDSIRVDGVVPLAEFACDYVIGSMTLPWRLGIEYKDLTGESYIEAEPAKIPMRGELNVGLVWRGNPAYRRDHMRSMAFEEYTPLFELAGAAFYSLQVGPASSEITNLGFDGFVADLQPFMKSWRQTARVIAALDVIVTVDTAVAHLAGAMGKPVMILITNGCDWRWNRESDHTAWYASARVIRQVKQDEWAPCIADVKTRLERMLDVRRQACPQLGESRESARANAG